jgi:hypothetical protein
MIQEKKPYTTLIELKLTNWYQERSDKIKEAIEETPPGYYYYSENNEEYRCIGWSDPKGKETETYVLLQREISGGTETLRILPIFVMKEYIEEYGKHITEDVSNFNNTLDSLDSLNFDTSAYYVRREGLQAVTENESEIPLEQLSTEVWVSRTEQNGSSFYLIDSNANRIIFSDVPDAIIFLRDLGEEGTNGAIYHRFNFERVYN